MSQGFDPSFPVQRKPGETIKPAYQNVEVTEAVDPETTSDASEATKDSGEPKAP